MCVYTQSGLRQEQVSRSTRSFGGFGYIGACSARKCRSEKGLLSFGVLLVLEVQSDMQG